MAKQHKIKPIKTYSEEQKQQIVSELFEWFYKKPENIFIEDFLLDEKKIFKNDLDFMMQTDENFKLLITQAKHIELSRLKKHGAGDRLNSSIVNKILINDHNWD